MKMMIRYQQLGLTKQKIKTLGLRLLEIFH